MEAPSVLPEEIGPRFYLIGPDIDEPADPVARHLPLLLEVLRPVAFRVRSRDDATNALASCRRICATSKIAFFVEDEPGQAQACGADGIHLSRPDEVAAARRLLGPERIIGADCGLSRHQAMIAGEDGADYVAFVSAKGPVDPSLHDLLGWWRALCTLPCLTLVDEPAEVAHLINAGADFLGVGGALWGGSAKEAGDRAAALRQAMEAAF